MRWASSRGGDRLPYVEGASGDNFAPLSSLDWQAHVYGEAAPAFHAALDRTGVPLHAFDWTAAAAKAGLVRDAAYLVRPDGHVALASAGQDPALFGQFIADLGITPRRDIG